MKSDDYSDLSGHTITKIVIDNEARLIALTTYHSEEGWFDAAGAWIGIYETIHEVLFSEVSSHSGVENLEKEEIGTLSHNPTEKKYTLTTRSNKTAVIVAGRVDVTKHAY